MEEIVLASSERSLDPMEDDDDGPVAFTDIVLSLYLEGLPSHTHGDGEEVYDAGPLSEAVVGAFALGCAVGLEYPEHVRTILDQTHPGAVDQIIEECRAPLAERVKEARSAGAPLGPKDFLESLVEAIEHGHHVDSDTAHNALSMSFEYSCIVAHVERGAALVVRNTFNREQEAAVRDFESGESTHLPTGPDPYQSIQDLAREIMTAYEADIGFEQP